MSRLTLLHINIIGVVVALIVAGGLYFTIITGALLVIGAASNGRRVYQPKPEWVEVLLEQMDRQYIPVFFKGNLAGNPAAAVWREDYPGKPTDLTDVAA